MIHYQTASPFTLWTFACIPAAKENGHLVPAREFYRWGFSLWYLIPSKDVPLQGTINP